MQYIFNIVKYFIDIETLDGKSIPRRKIIIKRRIVLNEDSWGIFYITYNWVTMRSTCQVKEDLPQ